MNKNMQSGQLKEIKKQEWNCGCCQTSDNYFKFCNTHSKILQKAIQDKIDDLDMTLVIEEKK